MHSSLKNRRSFMEQTNLSVSSTKHLLKQSQLHPMDVSHIGNIFSIVSYCLNILIQCFVLLHFIHFAPLCSSVWAMFPLLLRFFTSFISLHSNKHLVSCVLSRFTFLRLVVCVCFVFLFHVFFPPKRQKVNL